MMIVIVWGNNTLSSVSHIERVKKTCTLEHLSALEYLGQLDLDSARPEGRHSSLNRHIR